MASVFELFVRSARERKPIACVYDGHARQLCVHVVGYRHGEPKALAFQFAGGNVSGLPPGGEWRCLFLDRVGDARIVDGGWHSTSHSQPQTCVDRVVVQVRD